MMGKATVTTIYTGGEIGAGEVYELSQLDFTTWETLGMWQGEPERARVWQYIGTEPIKGRLFVAAVREAARAAGEDAIYVTTAKVDAELVSLDPSDLLTRRLLAMASRGGTTEV